MSSGSNMLAQLGVGAEYKCTTTVNYVGRHLEASGRGTSAKDAKDACATNLAEVLRPYRDHLKQEQNRVREENEREGKLDNDWMSTLVMAGLMTDMKITYIGGKDLEQWVQAEINAANEQQKEDSCRALGMDTEGHRGDHAKYMQIAGPSSAVVFRLNKENCESVLPLFIHKKIKLVVVNIDSETRHLTQLINLDARAMLNLYDLQVLGQVMMPPPPTPNASKPSTPNDSKPSLVRMVSHILDVKPTLVKFANLDAIKLAHIYAPFEKELTNDTFPRALLLYAGMDAIAPLWAFHCLLGKATPKQISDAGVPFPLSIPHDLPDLETDHDNDTSDDGSNPQPMFGCSSDDGDESEGSITPTTDDCRGGSHGSPHGSPHGLRQPP